MKSANYKIAIIPFTILYVSAYAFNAHRSRPAYEPVYSNGVMNKDIVALAKIQNPQENLPPTSLYLKNHLELFQ